MKNSGFYIKKIMGVFGGIIEGLHSFNTNAWDYVAESLKANKEDILYINTGRLIDKGTNSEGKKLKNQYASYRGYSPGYLKIKKKEGVYNGHINLYRSGEYLTSWQLDVNTQEVTIDVDASNADLDAVLKDMYGLEIQGLSEREWSMVVSRYIVPYLFDKLSKALK